MAKPFNKPFKLTRWARAGLSESSWAAAAVLVAAAFLAGFVLLADPGARIEAIWEQLHTPVNVIRLVVLAAAVWIWVYIMRIIRSVGPDQPKSQQRKARKRLRLRRIRRARRESELRAASPSPIIIVRESWDEPGQPGSDQPA